ncbi:MAG TPA: hypothetical protein VNN18_13335 [Candidatus Xenobia bacterium]|nr:hypothetical protein [Candidatus Xenobia bacterium]
MSPDFTDPLSSWKEGFGAGYRWFLEAPQVNTETGPPAPDRPHRLDDPEFNLGVEHGIRQAQRNRYHGPGGVQSNTVTIAVE